MATVTRKIEVCDVCRDMDAPVEHYRLSAEGARLKTVALCMDDAFPIEDLLEKLNATVTKAAKKRSPRQLSSVEELDKIAEEQAAPPKRRPGRPRKTPQSA